MCDLRGIEIYSCISLIIAYLQYSKKNFISPPSVYYESYDSDKDKDHENDPDTNTNRNTVVCKNHN